MPLSVFPTDDVEGRELRDAVVGVYTRPGDLVLDATGAAAAATAGLSRRCVALLPPAAATAVTEDLLAAGRGAGGLVRSVEVDELCDVVAGYVAEVQLIVAAGVGPEPHRWWRACRGALVPGGYVAIVAVDTDRALHTGLVASAAASGLAYVQHLVVVSSADLDRAVTATGGSRRSAPGRHRRVHRDVYVFTSPIDAAGVAR